MIERVARAICIEQGFPPDDKYRSSRFEGCEPREFQWHAFQPEAVAAIEAMREPTEAMAKAGAEYTKDDFGADQDFADCAKLCWLDMIDAALK